MKNLSLLLVLSALCTHAVMADDNTSAYSFGGACSSQGQWTQSALSTTGTLRQVITKLKDNPKCHALGNSVQSAITNLEQNIQSTANAPQSESRLMQIPQEIGALRSYVLSNPADKSNILSMIMDRSIEGATISAKVGEGNELISQKLVDLGSRVQRGTKDGIKLLNQVIDTIPEMDECLDNKDSQVLGSFFSATVHIASSFASSGQDSIGNNLATTIAKITSLARARKYSLALRELNKQEFKASMSCLMEVTSESYCQVIDQLTLFQSSMKELKAHPKKLGSMDKDNPFAGYYILNTHVPNITKFLQKVQIGVDPKLPTDAQYQNSIQQDVTNFYKNVKTLKGEFNQRVETIKSQKDIQAKKNSVIELVLSIVNHMTNTDDGKINFFTMSTQEINLPFILLGMPVPNQVKGGENVQRMDYASWLKSNMDSIPNLNSPVDLTNIIGTNMNKIINDSDVAAIDYYNQWYIVDKSALVDESLTNVNYTIVDSLKAIMGYLNIAEDRNRDLGGNHALIADIENTKARIQAVLNAYQVINDIGNKLAQNRNKVLTDAELQANSDANEKLINTILLQFNIMQSRSGFLANRMVNFVKADYILLSKQKDKNNQMFSEKSKDLFISQGMSAFDRMLQSYNGNPANIKTDLNMALSINNGNLNALEGFLKNSVAGQMSDYEDSITGKGGFTTRLSHETRDFVRDSKGIKALRLNPFTASSAFLYFVMANKDRYPGQPKNGERMQSQFGESTNLKAQLCIQALAFKDQAPFLDYCSGVVLESPFQDEKELNASYDEIANRYLNDSKYTAVKREALNMSDRVCAFRDFNRKNMVRYMKQNVDDSDTSNK